MSKHEYEYDKAKEGCHVSVVTYRTFTTQCPWMSCVVTGDGDGSYYLLEWLYKACSAC